LQLVAPIGQLSVQLPLTQTCPEGQTVPQPPQLLLSICGLTQTALQTISPIGQAHALFTQLAPIAQTLPHIPQFFGSLVRLTQLPLQLV
jgi:hypothetical protein